jgi:hypothetical protein
MYQPWAATASVTQAHNGPTVHVEELATYCYKDLMNCIEYLRFWRLSLLLCSYLLPPASWAHVTDPKGVIDEPIKRKRGRTKKLKPP